MTEVITIGVDLAKNVFQVHGVDAEGGPGVLAAGTSRLAAKLANKPRSLP